MQWIIKTFEELTTTELYDLLQLRCHVFVVEQNCPYPDLDDKDKKALHVMGYEDEKLVAYSRLFKAGDSYKEAAIGRVVTNNAYRNKGIGRGLMEKSIETIYERWGRQSIRIGAQLYLRNFYESLGFTQQSDMYLEDGIEHIEMLLL